MRQNKQTKTKQKAIKKELNIKNYGEIFLYKHKILKIYKEFNFFLTIVIIFTFVEVLPSIFL